MQTVLEEHIEQWNLTPNGEQLDTFSSVLQFVKYGQQPAVLKVFKPHSDEKLSAQILSQYAGHGAVKILELSDHAILLERIIPGRMLAELVIEGDDGQATQIFCDTASKLHAAKFDPNSCKPISALIRAFDKYLASGSTILPADRVEQAKSLFEQLCASQAEPVLLHGDLHHDNILLDNKRGWLCIDPKGYIGEPAFEVGAFLKNPKHQEYYAKEEIVDRRIAIISGKLNLDPDKLLLWAYCHSVLSNLWGIEDGEFTDEWLIMSDLLYQMVTSRSLL